MKFSRKSSSVAMALMASLCAGAAQAAIVYSNNAAPGDTYTNATTSNQGQAVGSTGWYYNNVRNSGVAGINTTYARSGNASAYLETTLGPGAPSSKADIEFLANGTNVGGNFFANGSLGLFSQFAGMSYDWYRDSTSTNSAVQHPALRILLDLDGDLTTPGDRGGLVFERVYNGFGNAPTNTWISDLIGGSTKLWNFGLGLGNEFDIDGDGTPYDTLTEWQSSARFANATILGFSAGVGSGWGPFKGAVDNIGWTIGTQPAALTNFEVQSNGTVPEPTSMALLGSSLLAAAIIRRRRKPN